MLAKRQEEPPRNAPCRAVDAKDLAVVNFRGDAPPTPQALRIERLSPVARPVSFCPGPPQPSHEDVWPLFDIGPGAVASHAIYLIFADDPLGAIGLCLDSVLGRVARLGQPRKDRVEATGGKLLKAIWRKPHTLSS